MSEHANDNKLKPGLKGQLTSLWNRIERVRKVLIHEVPTLIRSAWKGEATSFHDQVTKLPNRAAYNRALPRMINAAIHHGNPQDSLCLIFIDLDGFKAINDALGHAAGDEALKEFGDRIREHIKPREDDFIGRSGGDEFFYIVHGQKEHIINKISYFRQFMDDRRSCINDTAPPSERQKKYSFSMGLACLDQDFLKKNFGLNAPQELATALRNGTISIKDIGRELESVADKEMYENKKGRKAHSAPSIAPGMAA